MKNQEAPPIPHYLEDLPKDPRGFPITYTSIKLPDGRYDFTTTDPRKWEQVVFGRLCALCGKPHEGEELWFIGGPKCMHYRMFFDPPMHEACARYSFEVCPYLAMPKYLGAKKRLMPDHLRVELTSSDKTKPQLFGLATTRHYKPVVFQGDKLVLADKWTREIEWFKDGERTEAP